MKIRYRPSFRLFRPPIILLLLLSLLQLQPTAARPEILQEQDLNYHKAFYQGTRVGFETLLALLGYYESEEVKKGFNAEELIIDAEDEENQTQIKVVGLGLGRTGTTSLAMALEILGYSVVHDDEETELTDLFYAVNDLESIDSDEFHEILGLRGYNASFKTDYEWVQRHNEVKAILTVRDSPEKYVESWSIAAPFVDIMERIPFRWMSTVDALSDSFYSEYKEETTGGNPENYLDPAVLKEGYLEYIETIQAAIPSQRLLTFNVKQGWKPLCKFLKVEERDCPSIIPFPHVHTRAKLEGEMFFLRAVMIVWPLAILLPLYLAMKFGKLLSEMLHEKSKNE